LGAERVIDIGCGTGCLAILLAESGRTVVAVDPAEASLEVARSKDTAGRVTPVTFEVPDSRPVASGDSGSPG
jgi:2-polyprenyl-3-methyl-5-hydroxy-6-metoxy-1,4-benzoquinol methylase